MLLQPDAFGRDEIPDASLRQASHGHHLSETDIATFERDGVVCLRRVSAVRPSPSSPQRSTQFRCR